MLSFNLIIRYSYYSYYSFLLFFSCEQAAGSALSVHIIMVAGAFSFCGIFVLNMCNIDKCGLPCNFACFHGQACPQPTRQFCLPCYGVRWVFQSLLALRLRLRIISLFGVSKQCRTQLYFHGVDSSWPCLSRFLGWGKKQDSRQQF